MKTLSQSHMATQASLASGEIQDAMKTFKAFVSTVKDFYAESASLYPVRFSKIQESKTSDWCTWTRNLCLLTNKAEKALDGGDAKASEKLLKELRAHFFDLHTIAQALKSNDYVYAFMDEASKEAPSVDKLKEARSALEKADLSFKAKEDGKVYAKALAKWIEAIAPILSDDKIDPNEIEKMRSETAPFYESYGAQFE